MLDGLGMFPRIGKLPLYGPCIALSSEPDSLMNHYFLFIVTMVSF